MRRSANLLLLALSLTLSWTILAGEPALAAQNQQPAQGQQGQAPPGQAGQQGAPVTKEQGDDFQALRNEASTGLDPDRVIQLAADFEKKYPTSPMLSYADMFAASAFQLKGDVDKSIEYGEKSLKLKPDNLMTLIILASLLPTPQALKGNPADKDKKLTEAEKDANDALQIINQAPSTQFPKQPNETDDQLKKRKDALSSELHSALGMVHLERSSEGLQGPDKEELAKAEGEYKMATVTADKPNPQDYFRLGEAYSMDGKVDEAIDAFTKASQIGQGGPIQKYADDKVEELKKRKAQITTPPPAKP